MINFDKKNIFISGSSGNLGKALIKYFKKFDSKIYTTSKNADLVKRKNLQKNKNITYYHLDFNNKISMQKIKKDIKSIKNIDILINNSGINKIDEIYKINDEDWEKIININLSGAFFLSREISKIMKKNMKGKILNISSIFGTVGKSKRVSYSSSKWGLIGLTKSSSLDLAKYNILVNAISPGVIESELTNKILGKKGIHKIKKDIPLNRLASIDEIVNVISFLVSDKNTYMTGQNIVIDGGFTSA